MPGLPGVELSGKVALVAGGAHGIGAAIAEWLGSAGAAVMVADSDPAALARTEARTAFATEADVGQAFVSLRERFGRLDILVCAQRGRAPDLETSTCLQHGGPLLREGAGSGRVVVLGSEVPGLRDLVESAATELAADRITVNGIVPGAIRGDLADAELDAAAARIPGSIVGEPDDVARAVVWLVDPDNAYVTGRVFEI